jgi:hypothetical protein
MIERLVTSRHGLRVRVLGLLLVLGVAAGPTPAAEARQAAPQAPKRSGMKLRLDDTRLVPRVSVAMESLSTFHRGVQPGGSLHDHVMFDEMSEAVRDSAKSVTRKAVRNYLFETINLDRGIERVKADVRGERSSKRSIRFRLGFHSAKPLLGVQSTLGRSTWRFRAGADGEVAVGLTSDRFERAEMSVILDEDDTVFLHGRLGF